MRFAAVLFDFHGTLVQVEEPIGWVVEAAAACGHRLDRAEAAGLAEALVAAGRAGGPFPARVPAHLEEAWRGRDLSPAANRAAYTGLAETVGCGIDGLPAALYARLLTPQGWQCYPDTMRVLRELRCRNVRIAVVSNIGFDIRPIAEGLGFAALVDAWALSCEVGAAKPDPAIFTAACGLLGVAPEETMMVGDTPADAGAVAAGCTCLVVPVRPAGAGNGLPAVLELARP